MRSRFSLYAPFLLALTSTVALAQQPTPQPTTLKCTGKIPSPACTAATTVYNAIMANATATTALAGMVTTVQNAMQTGSTGDPMVQSAQALLTSGPPPNFMNYVKKCEASYPPSPACYAAEKAYTFLWRDMDLVQSDLQYFNGNSSLLSAAITNLVATQGTLGGLQGAQGTRDLTTIVSDLNHLNDALSMAQAIPLPPPAPATPQKRAVSSKK